MSYGKMEELKRIIRDVMLELDDGSQRSPKRAVRVLEITPPTEKEQRVMDTMLWLMETTGKEAFMPNIVAYFSRFAVDAPAFIDTKKALRRLKYIELVYGGHMRLTEAGKSLSKSQHALTKASASKKTDSKAASEHA